MTQVIKTLAAQGAAWQPVLPLISLGVSVLLFLLFMALLVLLRFRVTELTRQMSGRQTALATLSAELEAQALLARQMSVDLEELRKRLLNHEESVPAVPTSWGANAGLPINLNRRGQILRLSRKGRSVAEIASDLNIAQGEVDLLLKVSDLSSKLGGEK